VAGGEAELQEGVEMAGEGRGDEGETGHWRMPETKPRTSSEAQ
jgi:hypothetical protein